MSRRKRRRRARKARPEPVPVADKPVNYDRLGQIYSNLTCRRQPVLGVVSLGIEVRASSPEEMNAKTWAVIAELTRNLPQN